jgi:imidazolonepropionase
MIITGIQKAWTNEGLVKTGGRHPNLDTCSATEGPLTLEIANDGVIIDLRKYKKGDVHKSNIDVDGASLTPGFIDSHTHLLYSGNRFSEHQMRWNGSSYQEISKQGGGILSTMRASSESTQDEHFEIIIQRLKKIFQEGITSCEIKSGYGLKKEDELNHLRTLNKIKQKTHFQNETPNIAITYLGLHALPKNETESNFVSDRTKLLETIQRESLNVSYVDTFPELGFFSLESASHFSLTAKKIGFQVKVHADEITPMGVSEHFIEMGAVSIDHLQKISERAIKMLSKSTTVATLLPTTSFFLKIEFANARKLIDSGAIVSLASDSNPGTSPWLGLKLTRWLAGAELKMSTPEIFAGVTLNAAKSLNFQNRGYIASGGVADLCFWKSTSLDEILLSDQNPAFVMKSGHLLSQNL